MDESGTLIFRYDRADKQIQLQLDPSQAHMHYILAALHRAFGISTDIALFYNTVPVQAYNLPFLPDKALVIVK